jgi:branched-chain amino acid transport system permease protein
MKYHYLLTIIVAAVVALLLWYLLNRTRIGTAMRAAVDNRELLELFGASANRVSMLSWAVGSSLAALAGVLLVSQTGLDYYGLTFLVINAFAAAMLGRLRSLPMTYLGAILLGLAIGYSQYVRGSQLLETGLQFALPTLMLFLILIFVPEVRLRVGQVKGILAANVPSARQTLLWAAVLVLATMTVLQVLSPTHKLNYGDAIILSITMLSLVLLTGYGGFVSLSPARWTPPRRWRSSWPWSSRPGSGPWSRCRCCDSPVCTSRWPLSRSGSSWTISSSTRTSCSATGGR